MGCRKQSEEDNHENTVIKLKYISHLGYLILYWVLRERMLQNRSLRKIILGRPVASNISLNVWRLHT
jgi:hypothetical protein